MFEAVSRADQEHMDEQERMREELPRSSRPDVRNPVLGLASMARVRELDPECRRALAALLLEIRAEARVKAEQSWRTGKGPMAAYWKAVSVYAGHIARASRPEGGTR